VIATGSAALFPGRLAAAIHLPAPGNDGDGAVVGLVPFVGEGAFPVEQTVGEGLGKRRSLDLSSVTPASLVTPSERFFIRTGCPVRRPEPASWKVKVHGLAHQPREISIAQLRAQAVDQGLHLLECAGNSKAAHFGFLSVARWKGAPLWPLVEDARPGPRATQVLVSGYDEHDVQDRGSVPGASWIFALDRLRDAGAFLATAMNGAPLSPDHGSPLRLVVPGWYGCAAIKWVNEIVLLDGEAPATEQMREYAGRTHQTSLGAGVPLARDFEPATLDPAATAVRVEKRRGHGGKTSYRIVGILWGADAGGRKSIPGVLQIRTRPEQPFVPVEQVATEERGPVRLWSHTFRPEASGRYEIALRLAGPVPRTRRLDVGFYSRAVEIVISAE
jgi:DMSO/TMAO reductase YedYZ molybdopterin-dependent catalytic subunit